MPDTSEVLENCNSSSEKDAKVLCMPHKTTFDMLSNRFECHKVPRLPRKTKLQLVLAPWNRIGFAASSIDTARPQENQRLETIHVGASKRAFRARHPPIFTRCSFEIDVFLRVFLWTSKLTTSKAMFRARRPSSFQHASQNAMPATEFARCRHLTQPWQCDSQKHATPHV